MGRGNIKGHSGLEDFKGFREFKKSFGFLVIIFRLLMEDSCWF
jgi:hypothetical protein